MATRSTPDSSTRPGWQHPFLLPGLLAVAAVIFLLLSEGAFAFASLLLSLGALLYLMGTARRWKGAPQAGLVVAAVGLFVAVWALIG